MYSVKVESKSLRTTVYRDILGTDINVVYMKVMHRAIDRSSIHEDIFNLNYSDITPENALDIAKQYGYTLTDVTAQYEPQHTIIGGTK